VTPHPANAAVSSLANMTAIAPKMEFAKVDVAPPPAVTNMPAHRERSAATQHVKKPYVRLNNAQQNNTAMPPANVAHPVNVP
jgi:hypothetical protein